MFYIINHSKTKQRQQLYNQVLTDVASWWINELRARPLDKQIVNNTQTNALVNFITFDLHTLVTKEGYIHMQELLRGDKTEQTVMIRLKDLVVELYLKYGEKEIDDLRERTYRIIDNMYGLTFKSQELDVNNTFWLWPFFKHAYDTIPSA